MSKTIGQESGLKLYENEFYFCKKCKTAICIKKQATTGEVRENIYHRLSVSAPWCDTEQDHDLKKISYAKYLRLTEPEGETFWNGFVFGFSVGALVLLLQFSFSS